MSLLLHCIRHHQSFILNLPYLLRLQHQNLSPILLTLLQDIEQLLNLSLIITVFQKLLGFFIQSFVSQSDLLQFFFHLGRLVSLLDYLLLQEDFIALLFIDLELPFFDGLFVHLAHISKEQGLLPDLA